MSALAWLARRLTQLLRPRQRTSISRRRLGGSVARTYDLQGRLAHSLAGGKPSKGSSPGYAFEPEVVAILTTAFRAIIAELANRDEIVGLRAARRIIELAARGERDPERLKAVVRAMREIG